jgi:predicted SnoaL-like aldol condensation-catalyzing enzyme
VSTSRCESCGAAVAGLDGCRPLLDELIAREFGDYRYARMHRLTVDTYALQHPEHYMRSAKSFVAHLTGMCAAMETGDAAAINRSVQQWLNGPKAIERPLDVPRGQRGDLTIVHVHEATTPDDYLRRVQEWARSTWSAWASHHALAREWIALARK